MGYIVCFGMRHNVTTAHLLRSQGLLTLSVEIKKSKARAQLSNKKKALAQLTTVNSNLGGELEPRAQVAPVSVL